MFYLFLLISETHWFCWVLSSGYKWVMGMVLTQWSTAKLHRFTVACFFFSLFLSSFGFPLLIVLVLFLLSAGFPSLLRHQTWAPLRSVERALGSINRITGVARAGVYGVCLHRPGPGEGWLTVHWDFLLRSPLLPFLSLLLPLSVLPGYFDLSASSSHALPVLTMWYVPPVWEEGFLQPMPEWLYEWCLCIYV